MFEYKYNHINEPLQFAVNFSTPLKHLNSLKLIPVKVQIELLTWISSGAGTNHCQQYGLKTSYTIL